MRSSSELPRLSTSLPIQLTIWRKRKGTTTRDSGAKRWRKRSPNSRSARICSTVSGGSCTRAQASSASAAEARDRGGTR